MTKQLNSDGNESLKGGVTEGNRRKEGLKYGAHRSIQAGACRSVDEGEGDVGKQPKSMLGLHTTALRQAELPPNDFIAAVISSGTSVRKAFKGRELSQFLFLRRANLVLQNRRGFRMELEVFPAWAFGLLGAQFAHTKCATFSLA